MQRNLQRAFDMRRRKIGWQWEQRGCDNGNKNYNVERFFPPVYNT